MRVVTALLVGLAAVAAVPACEPYSGPRAGYRYDREGGYVRVYVAESILVVTPIPSTIRTIVNTRPWVESGATSP